MAGTGKIFVYQSNNWWSQLKTAGSAIYANRHYLELYKTKHPERLYNVQGDGCTVIPDVYVDNAATIHPSAVVRFFYIKFHSIFTITKAFISSFLNQCRHIGYMHLRYFKIKCKMA